MGVSAGGPLIAPRMSVSPLTNVKSRFTVGWMIDSFRHKGLQLLFEQDEGRKLKADQLNRLRVILSALN